MKLPLLLGCAFLLAQSVLSQTPSYPRQLETPATGCPLQVSEVWLDSAGATIPAGVSHKEWYLHLSLSNKGDQPVVGFVVHAELSALPDRSISKPEKMEHARRQWMGELAPAASLTHRWKITASSNTMGLKRVWLDEIKFADGSRWSGSGSNCSFAATGHLAPADAGH